jgi:hypothetical protein
MEPKLPKALTQGTLKIGHVEIPSFVLDDGRRVISGRGITAAIGMKGRGQGVTRIPDHSTIKRYLSSSLTVAIGSPIEWSGIGSRKSKPTAGYEGATLVAIAETILKARDAGNLKTEQEKRYGVFCEALMRSLAKIGIIALIDEATGYEKIKPAADLQRILSAYISAELLPWQLRFPDTFYKEMFRLRGWRYPVDAETKGPRGPRYAGKLTKELIFKQLPPGVLEALEERNPPDENWQRRHRHSQLLTKEIGNLHLEKQVAVVTALMRGAPNWRSFIRLFNRNFPQSNMQEEMDLEDVNEANTGA